MAGTVFLSLPITHNPQLHGSHHRPLSTSAATTKSKATGKKKVKKGAYNRYVKAQMPLMKAEATKKGEKFVSGNYFSKIGEMWKTAPENPKNQK
ncbi:uncharacterized protein EHS24_006301 [Apiotrichum porosum]|uniref:HMG box domain-containing protein n=1 Tax=Apiotrichum porosum TaxID=105984 RepID=A0A427Y0W1_9TREE|nr:uncharacterized protein EHS24_006301 [Apiotrichum porosum]RSH84776.1 hypothetical protein EHS24_006301 [Apiotrichum porosum]